MSAKSILTSRMSDGVSIPSLKPGELPRGLPDRGIDEIADIAPFQFRPDEPRFQTRHIQKVFHEPVQTPGGVVDLADELATRRRLLRTPLSSRRFSDVPMIAERGMRISWEIELNSVLYSRSDSSTTTAFFVISFSVSRSIAEAIWRMKFSRSVS
jgi:hypothetical protein